MTITDTLRITETEMDLLGDRLKLGIQKSF